MNRNAVPFAIAKSFYRIPLSFYRENDIHFLLLDLDNTLACYKDEKPTPEAIAHIRYLEENGIVCAIASNNTSTRVYTFAKDLGIPAYCRLHKPFAFGLRRLLQKEKIDPKKTVLIGDQIMTDVYAGNRAGIRVILCAPLTKLDPPWTKVNRFFAKPKKKKLFQEPYRSWWKEVPDNGSN